MGGCIFASSPGGKNRANGAGPLPPEMRGPQNTRLRNGRTSDKENTMAILTGINTCLRNSAGSWTFSRNKNTTIAMQKVEKKAVPVRSTKQMIRRMGWANIVAMWGSFTGNLKPSFERKGIRHSDFNAFMATNLDITNVYLKREEVRHNACVAAPYTMSQGSLPTIGVTMQNGGKMKSDISLGDLVIDSETTVGNFSKAVLDNNRDFVEGDQIIGFLVQQLSADENGTPKVRIEAGRVRLRVNSTRKLLDVVSETMFSTMDGYLATKTSVNGGVAWIHSRIEKGKTKVSTQRLTVNNNVLSDYTSVSARTAAIESYGGVNKQDYLTPYDDEETESAQTNP